MYKFYSITCFSADCCAIHANNFNLFFANGPIKSTFVLLGIILNNPLMTKLSVQKRQKTNQMSIFVSSVIKMIFFTKL